MAHKIYSNLTKALDFIELAIEGTYGEGGLTYKDWKKFDRAGLRTAVKVNGEGFLVIRETGCQHCLSLECAETEVRRFPTTSKLIVKLRNTLDMYVIEPIKIK